VKPGTTAGRLGGGGVENVATWHHVECGGIGLRMWRHGTISSAVEWVENVATWHHVECGERGLAGTNRDSEQVVVE
jgi:hypothetical protein